MGTTINSPSLKAPPGSGPVTYPGSVQSDWITVHDDLTATAETSSVLLRPLSYSNTNVHPIKVPPGATGIKIRGRAAQGLSEVATNPVVRIYGVSGPDPTAAGAFADDGTNWAERLDSSGDCDAAGVTIAVPAAAANRLRDTTYAYTDTYPAGTRYDCLGNGWVLILTETAGSVTNGGTPCLQIQFVN